MLPAKYVGEGIGSQDGITHACGTGEQQQVRHQLLGHQQTSPPARSGTSCAARTPWDQGLTCIACLVQTAQVGGCAHAWHTRYVNPRGGTLTLTQGKL